MFAQAMLELLAVGGVGIALVISVKSWFFMHG